MASLTVAMATMAAGAVLVAAGVLDPPGGPMGVVGELMSGRLPKRKPKKAGAVDWSKIKVGGGGDFGEGGKTPSPSPSPKSPAPGGTGARIVASARAQIGKPYVWGGNGPKVFDCSGLVYYVHNSVGVKIGDKTAEGYRVSGRAGLGEPGDVVCFGVPATHIGIVSASGKCIEAPNARLPVQERSINISGRNRPITYRRLW